jgi:CHAT domain-containing protein
MYKERGKVTEALAYSRTASAAVIRHAQIEGAGAQQSGSAKGLVAQRADYFRSHVAILWAVARKGTEPEPTLAHEAFEIAQWAAHSSAASALAQMAVRQAKGEGALAEAVRERQDLERQWLAADGRLNGAVAKGDVQLASALRSELTALNVKFTDVDGRLARDFPDYAELSNPKPLSIAGVQALLGEDEALFLALDTDESAFAWVVTKNDTRWGRFALVPRDIADKVQALRCGLDYDGEWRAADKERGERCLRLLKLKAPPKASEPAPFNLTVAYDLYEGLFGSFKDMIRDKRLLIVPSGALTSLPFQVLVTEKPSTAIPANGDYGGVAWLGQRHTMTVLPSVTSIKALREHTKGGVAAKPYMGFGNPLLTGPSGSDQSAFRKQSCAAGQEPAARQTIAARFGSSANSGKLVRGGLADLALLLRQQPLPETTDELCDVGHSLGASPGDILLGIKATERMVKLFSANGTLASYRVLHFATHGLLPQETENIATGLAEAALVLTPPDVATDEDDGLLTASEVAQLKLNADWVIMSACNTGGGDKSGEELSGLARAFFYAGARALLVSHWYVDSQSAVALTTKIFDEMRRDPSLKRAEALRRSMQALIASGGRFAHPANWAPFVLVGEGAVR